MAFVIAGVVVILTFLFAMMQAGDAHNRSDPDSSGASATITIGLSIAALIVASHWLAWPW